MNKLLIFGIFGTALFVLPKIKLIAQNDAGTLKKIEKCVQDYQDHSSLGNPGSTFIDSATIAAFKDLFEPNSNHCWDLYKTKAEKSNYLLTVDEYVDSVNSLYKGMKPVISYGKYDVKLNNDRKTAIVYLVKINSIRQPASPQKQNFTRNITTLRMLLNIYGDVALIQNVTRDMRLTRIRSLYFEWGYPFVTNITGKYFGQPASNIDPSVITGYSIGKISGYSIGLTADIRTDRQKTDGLLLNIGLIYSKNSFDIVVNNYVDTYRHIFDPGDNAYECTVFDRAPSISEVISLTSISLPVAVKWYISGKSPGRQSTGNQEQPAHENRKSKQSLRLKYYLKAGLQFAILSGITKVGYDLSHSGGGWIIYEREKNLPDPEKTWFYLDKNNERVDSPNFFAQKKFNYSSSIHLNKLQLSAMVAIGIEAKFNKILIGFEPWMNVGITSFSSQKGQPLYPLYPISDFTSFLQTFNSPRINSFGLNILIGRIFNRKY